MKFLKELLPLASMLLLIGCSKDDLPGDIIVEEAEIVVPNFAIIGDDLTTGSSGNVVTWTDSYQTATTINLQETLGFQFGFLRNTIGSELAIASGFPTSEFIFYDVGTGAERVFNNYFEPENPVGDRYAINSAASLHTYYLDNSSTCCNIYLNTFSQETGEVTEVFLGNGDIAPVQFNVQVRGNRTFATAIDTFTGAKKLYVHDASTGESLGTRDVSQYGAFIYNDVRDEIYLFDFTGQSLNHITLDISTFTASEVTSFPSGFTLSDGFNDAQFSDSLMVFKNAIGIISSTYNFDTDSIVTYESTNLTNIIFEETGKGISITNTAIDLETNTYVVLGTYQVDGVSQGIAVALTLEKEVIAVAESGDIRPNDVIFY